MALNRLLEPDDLIYIGNHESMTQEFKTMMMNEFAMTDLSKMRYFLGIEVLQGCNGIFIGKPYVSCDYKMDIAHFVSLISRFMELPKDKHFLVAKCILRYLQGTQNLRIFYNVGGNEELLAYTDSDYAENLDNRKSTSSYAFMLGDVVKLNL
ncbi:hypothetical protein CR513_02539, partial [Mucuna pruriens]